MNVTPDTRPWTRVEDIVTGERGWFLHHTPDGRVAVSFDSEPDDEPYPADPNCLKVVGS
jgi:hypothetical protein